jgi:DNA-directed RNA polymerase subunit M/transcription elongation factor TFIIS
MEENKNVNEQNLEEVSGGISKPTGPIKMTCPYCHTNEQTCVVRFIKKRDNTQVKIFHCEACNKDFEVGGGRSTLTQIR